MRPLVFALVLAAGCGTPRPATDRDAPMPPTGGTSPSGTGTTAPDAPTGDQHSAAGSRLVLIEGGRGTVAGQTLRFVGVAEDSRCPTDVDCVWAGRATARIALADGTVLELPLDGGVTLDSEAEAFSPVAHGTLHFTLVALDPYPTGTATTELKRATVQVEPIGG